MVKSVCMPREAVLSTVRFLGTDRVQRLAVVTYHRLPEGPHGGVRPLPATIQVGNGHDDAHRPRKMPSAPADTPTGNPTSKTYHPPFV